MKNRIAAILLVMVFAIALSVSAFAADNDKPTEFDVIFGADNTMQKTYDEESLNQAIEEMQPGDSVTLKFNLKNESSSNVSWYLNNTIVESLENNASGGVYSYVLTYTASDGAETTIYSSDTVNQDTGEDGAVTEDSDGLKNAVDELEDWVYLDKIAANGTGSVSLKITLDGETQANDYQNSSARINLQFAAEVEATTTQTNTNTNVVKTGDEFNMPVMVVVAGVSGALVLALAIWGVVARKKEKEDAAK